MLLVGLAAAAVWAGVWEPFPRVSVIRLLATLGNDLEKLAETVRIARWTRSIIYQNFLGTLTVDAVGVGLAAFGLLPPLVAAFIHVGSEMAFILNSARLLPRRHYKAIVHA